MDSCYEPPSRKQRTHTRNMLPLRKVVPLRRVLWTFRWVILTAGFVLLFLTQDLRKTREISQQIAEAEVETFISDSEPVIIPRNTQSPNRKLLIVSYQRCGSTFFGDIFGKHPDVTYFYEPLDGAYVSMYGTLEGWNVPTDIARYSNGSRRSIPQQENEVISATLDNLLNCRIASLPVEVLAHKFWKQFQQQHSSLEGYIKCVARWSSLSFCRNKIAKNCGHRFSADSINDHRSCHDRIHSPSVLDSTFNGYNRCLGSVRRRLSKCVDSKFIPKCKASTFHVVKTVRPTMTTLAGLLERNPDLLVVHLLRDPRSVVLSRSHFDPSSFSRYSFTDNHTNRTLDVSKEAYIYCDIAMADITLRNKLSKKFPGAILEVVYDNFLTDPIGNTQKIFDFIGVEFKEASRTWLRQQTSNSRVRKWQRELSGDEVRSINAQCEQLLTSLGLH